ncbi:hypothetical protein [Paenibacillus aquistagni]|uniref:Four-helix bundle copper-binding protein n=1 Tax=Paenibacillus aquistagni TaxID=1852522 RepID=A0A1X7ISI2_9BACL|nr:hypothetical protein [Paenibacillus aquistagni]SMG17701.1 hypothetical protein SAMN06295960_0727 [Paenibacillus aquistagni]
MITQNPYRAVIDACNEVIEACNVCISQTLQQEDLYKRIPILNQFRDCVDTCMLTLSLMTRQSHYAVEASSLCAEVASSCAKLCAQIDEPYAFECEERCKKLYTVCQTIIAA